MPTLADLNVTIGADITGLNAGMAQAGQSLENLGATAEKASGRYVDAAGKLRESNGRFVSSATLAAEAAGKTGGAISRSAINFSQLGTNMKAAGMAMTTYVTLPLALLAGASLKAAGDLQALEKGFAATYKGAGNVNDELRKTQEVAKLPGLGLKEAIQGATNLQAVGFAADQSRRILEGYGNALATVGKGKADLEGVITALSQMSAKGKISAEEINQIAERVPQIRKVMQDAFGTADTEVLQKMGISVDQFVTRTTAEINKLPKVTGGINNAFENMADSGFLALSKLGDAINKTFDVEGKLNALGDALGGLAESFGDLSPAAQGTILVVAGLVAAAGPLLLALGAVTAALPTLIAGFTALKVAMLGTAGTIGIVVAAIAAVGLVAYKIGKSMEVSSAQAEQANKAYKDQKTAFENLQTSISPLLTRYEELKAKTSLTKGEQAEMGDIIKKITGTLPNAATQFDRYGNAIDINADKVRIMVAEQKRLADSMRNTALQEQAKQLHINAGAIQEVNNLLKTGGRYKFDNRGGQTFQPLTNEEKVANATRLDFLRNQRDEYVKTYREIKGLLPLVAPTPPPADTKGQEKINSLLKVQNDLLDIQKGKIANATDEKSLGLANQRAAAIQTEIDRLESLGVANAKMQDTLKDLNQDLYLNGQYSKGLGDSYAFVDERRSILESGLKSLIAAGFAPGSATVKRFKAELDSLPQSFDLLKPSFENTIPSWAGYLQSFTETGRFVVTDLKAGFEALTGSVQKFNGTIMGIPVVLEAGAPYIDAFTQASIDSFNTMTGALQNLAVNGFSFLGETIGQALTGNFAGAEAFFGGMMQIIAGFLKSLGESLIAVGTAGLALKAAFANPLAAIAAGTALIVLSGIAGSIMKKGPTGGGGGTGSAPSYTAPTSRATNVSSGRGTLEITGETRILGNDLVVVFNRASNEQRRTG